MFANLNIKIVTLALPILLASCASYGPYHPNTSAQPFNSVRGHIDDISRDEPFTVAVNGKPFAVVP
jgi:hypothetical protein